MSTLQYDIIVLGSGFGGLITAAILAGKGRRVLLLKEKGYKAFYQRNGYRESPFSSFTERRLGPSLFQRISHKLSLSLLDWNLEKEVDVPSQVILPEARINASTEPSLLRKEWKREFPGELSQIEGIYKEFDRLRELLKDEEKKSPSPFFPLKRKSLLGKHFSFPFVSLFLGPHGIGEKLSSFSREFREFVRLQLLSRGNLLPDRFPVLLSAYMLLREEWSQWLPQMTLEKVSEDIQSLFLQSGGEIEEIERVEKATKEWGQGFMLMLAGDRRIFQGRALTLNGPLHSFAKLSGNVEKVIVRWSERVYPRYLLFPCFLGVREKVVPCGMRDLLVSILDLERPYEQGNLLLLGISPRASETASPEGHRMLTAVSLIPVTRLGASVDLDQTSAASHEESVMGHLNHLIPFLERYIEFADFDWAREETRRWSYPHFLYETASDFDWREGIVPNRLSHNLYFVGKENFPYLGLEGEVLSGLMVAEAIEHGKHFAGSELQVNGV